MKIEVNLDKTSRSASIKKSSGSTIIPSNKVAEYRISESEFYILEALFNNVGSTMDRGALSAIGWEGRIVSPNSIPVAINNLRRVLDNIAGDNSIYTEKGVGYGFKNNLKINIQFTSNKSKIHSSPKKKEKKVNKFFWCNFVFLLIIFIYNLFLDKKILVDIYSKKTLIALVAKGDDNVVIELILNKQGYKFEDTLSLKEIHERGELKQWVVVNVNSGNYVLDCVGKDGKVIALTSNKDSDLINVLSSDTGCLI